MDLTESIKLLEQIQQKLLECKDETDAHEDEYSNGFRAGYEEGKMAAYNTCIKLVAQSIADNTKGD